MRAQNFQISAGISPAAGEALYENRHSKRKPGDGADVRPVNDPGNDNGDKDEIKIYRSDGDQAERALQYDDYRRKDTRGSDEAEPISVDVHNDHPFNMVH